MAKFASDEMLDAALAVAAGATRLVLLPGQPASYAAAVAARLAETALTPADFAITPAPGGGRRLTVAARDGLIALAAGSCDHVALLDGPGQRLLYVTTCPARALSVGQAVTVAAWQVEIGAPL